MLKIPNKETLQKEKEIQKNIYKCIDEFKSFVFYAGAGAGKTYALKESIKYILKHKREELKRKNQKIICITYTNVAVNEIKRRIGNTELVLVSTIHERVWNIIKNYQKELILIHKEKLKENIEKLQEEIEKIKFYTQYEKKDELINKIIENGNQLLDIQFLKAKEYEEELKKIINISISRKVEEFKKLVKNILKYEKYKNAINQINNNEIKEVKYDMFFNSDRLDKMKFSHNTLLEYFFTLIKRYKGLQRILVDKYPYIFIDEFQDTDKYITESLKILFDYAKEKNKNFLLGYFGDGYQTIYDVNSVIGKNILKEDYLVKIDKVYNRRSCSEIISLINKIRNDKLKQETIYEDADGGKIELHFGEGEFENIQKHIKDICENYNINTKNKLHILFLTNKLIAQFAGFEEFYNIFKNFIDYKNLTTQIMSKDITKLNETVLFIFYLLKIYYAIKNKRQINEILKKQDLKDIYLYQYKKEILNLNLNNIKTFTDLFKEISTNQTILMQRIRKKYFEINSLKELKIYFAEKLNIKDEKLNILKELMELDINTLMKWYKYITSTNESESEKLIYHTCHSTKGEEYDNVLIVMQNNFGLKKKDAIKKFFIEPDKCNEDIINLLYVSFSRVKKNLFVYYIDNNLSETEKSIIRDFIEDT